MQEFDLLFQQLKWAAQAAGLAPIAGAAALTIGTILALLPAVPAVRRAVAPFPQQPSFRDACPYLQVRPDGVTVSCRGNRIMRAWRLHGADHATMTPADRFSAWQSRCDTLNSFSEMPLSVRFLSIRLPTYFHSEARQHPADLAPPISELLSAWHNNFRDRTTYTNTHWIVAYAPDSKAGRGALDTLSDRILASLSIYQPAIADCTPGHAIAELLTAILSPTAPHAPLLQPGADIPDLVCTSAYEHHDTAFSFTGHGRELHFAPFGIRALPDTFSENTITELLRVSCPLILSHMIHPVPRAPAIFTLARQRRVKRAFSLAGPDSTASGELEQCIEALEGSHPEISAANLFNHQFCILAGATGPAELKANTRLIQKALAPSGTAVVTEGFASRCAYWSIFPSFDTPHRPFRVLTPHLAAWLLPQSTPAGLSRSDWTDRPLATFRTADKSPYHFQWHVSEEDEAVPHCMVIAPTGSGKTTLLSFLAAHTLALHDAQVWIFDRFQGTEIFVRAAGGDYLTITGDDAVRMNPFLLEDTPANRHFLRQWLTSLITDPSPQDIDDIARMVLVNYDYMPPHRRSLANLYKGTLTPASTARQHLHKWVAPDQYGAIFNASRDTTTEALGSRITAYDCTTVFDDPQLAPPLISYLTHRIRALSASTARPTLVYIDETAPMLKSEEFRRSFIAGLQEGRKLRQAYICAFQDPAAISDAGVASVIRGQCQTAILMPNTQASQEAYAPLDLTDSEFDFVSARTHRDLQHAALIKRYPTAHSAILETDLRALGNHLRLFASGQRAVHRFRALLHQHDHAPAIRKYLS